MLSSNSRNWLQNLTGNKSKCPNTKILQCNRITQFYTLDENSQHRKKKKNWQNRWKLLMLKICWAVQAWIWEAPSWPTHHIDIDYYYHPVMQNKQQGWTWEAPSLTHLPHYDDPVIRNYYKEIESEKQAD